MKIGVKLFLLLALTFATGASSSETTLPPDPSAELELLYQEAERSYLGGQQSAAIQGLAKFFKDESNATVRTRIRAYNLRGLIHFQGRNLRPAVQDFEAAVQLANRNLEATDSLLHLTRYNLGNALFQTNRLEDAQDTLNTVNADALDQDTRMRFFHLLGNVLAAKSDHLEAVIQYLTASHLAKDIAPRDTFLQKALGSSKFLYLKDPKGDLDRISSLKLPNDSPAGVASLVLRARGAMYSGNPSEAKSLLQTALEKAEPFHPLRSQAEEMLNDLGKLAEVNENTIGVLLPLSGRFGRFGRLCLNAIMMAFGAFENMTENPGNSKIRLVIRDSGETPEAAQEKFEELVKDEKAIAVIGPLLSRQFPGVARKAQEFGVPLFSLSQRMEASQIGSYIFPIALSPNQQIDLIVSQAMNVNGYKRFAILAPNDTFGDEYISLFWDAVEKAGGSIVGIERYAPKSTDFREEVKRLVGLQYLGARKSEVEELKRRGEKYGATLKVRGKLRQRLMKAYDPKAIVDFDAIFIPDDPATVGQIAPAFAVQDVSNIPLLGINTWNTSEIVQRAGRYLQRSLFVDSFFANSQNPQTLKFVNDYSSHFQATPGTIEVQAFDAGRILIDALGEGRPSNRARLRDFLFSREKFSGISGDFRFSPSGVQRGAHLLTVRGNSIVELQPGNSAQN